MPQTYMDAINITRSLGMRYLWIDSFCIIQDDVDDWKRESELMGDIYENAYFNIAATTTSGEEKGFLTVRKTEPIYVYIPSSDGSDFSFTNQEDSNFDREVNQVRLNSRGWVVQERLLSRRTIHFAADMWYWECGECVISEDGWQHPLPNNSPTERRTLRNTLDGPAAALGKVFCIEESSKEEDQSMDGSPTTEILWAQVLRTYSKCDLTFPSDKLPALQGLANKFKELRSSGYSHGHWLQTQQPLPLSLMWAVTVDDGYRVAEPQRAASWSCLKGDGSVEFYDTRGTTPCTMVDRIEGDFSSIALRGRIRNAKVAMPNGENPVDKPTHYSLSFKSQTQYGTFINTLGPACFDDANHIPSDVTLLLGYENFEIARYGNSRYTGAQKDQLALVMHEISEGLQDTKSGGEGRVKRFKRIGTAHVNNHTFFKDVPFSSFIIE